LVPQIDYVWQPGGRQHQLQLFISKNIMLLMTTQSLLSISEFR